MDKRFRILAINPNSDLETCRSLEATIARFGGKDFTVDVRRLETAPLFIATYEDRVAAVDELCRLLRDCGGNYDAFIIACHADPNLELVREITGKPVVGIGEASMKIAASLGNGFAIISPSSKTKSRKYALAQKYHLGDFLKTVVVSNGDSGEDLLAAAQEALIVPGVDSIVLGCANYTGADGFIEDQLKIPVIDGFACALFMAAGLARYEQYKQDSRENRGV